MEAEIINALVQGGTTAAVAYKGLDILKEIVIPTVNDGLKPLIGRMIGRMSINAEMKFLEKVEKKIKNKNLLIKQVSLKDMNIILEKVSLESNEFILDKWENLLVNALSTKNNFEKNLVPHFLSQMSKLDLVILDVIYSISSDPSVKKSYWEEVKKVVLDKNLSCNTYKMSDDYSFEDNMVEMGKVVALFDIEKKHDLFKLVEEEYQEVNKAMQYIIVSHSIINLKRMELIVKGDVKLDPQFVSQFIEDFYGEEYDVTRMLEVSNIISYKTQTFGNHFINYLK